MASHGDHVHPPAVDEAQVRMLDLEGEVLQSYWADITTALRQSADGASRILDLGAGTGTGSVALAQRFEHAEVIAADSSSDMLARTRGKAVAFGLADRISTRLVDLDDGWPDTEPLDVVWASMSLHHFTDPDRVLRDAYGALPPGGVLGLAELVEPLRCLPDDLGIGRPGLETRFLDAFTAEHNQQLPHLGAQWSPHVVSAGFELIAERKVAIDLAAPHPPAVGEYVQLWFARLLSVLGHRLDADDRATLRALVEQNGPDALRRRTDLHLRGARTLIVAVRPG